MDMAFGNKGGMRRDRNIRPSAKHQTSTLEDRNTRQIQGKRNKIEEEDGREREKQLLTMRYPSEDEERKR